MRTPRPWPLPTQPATRSLLVAAGASVGMISSQVHRGHLLRVRQGVYLAASAWPGDPAGQHLVRAHAELVANPEAVLSHASAAVAWGVPSPGFEPWHAGPVTVTVAPGRGRRPRRTSAVHHVAALPPEAVARDADGYPVTSIGRTAADLVAGLALPEALVVLDAALRLLCASLVAVPRRSDYANERLVGAAREVVLRGAGARPGAGLVPAVDLADPRRESPAESLSAGHFEVAGLPRPLFQQPVATPRGTLFPDCLWPEQRLVGECDGAVKYAEAGAYVEEKRREQALRDLGFGVVRWLGSEIMTRPDVVVERVGRALAS